MREVNQKKKERKDDKLNDASLFLYLPPVCQGEEEEGNAPAIIQKARIKIKAVDEKETEEP